MGKRKIVLVYSKILNTKTQEYGVWKQEEFSDAGEMTPVKVSSAKKGGRKRQRVERVVDLDDDTEPENDDDLDLGNDDNNDNSPKISRVPTVILPEDLPSEISSKSAQKKATKKRKSTTPKTNSKKKTLTKKKTPAKKTTPKKKSSTKKITSKKKSPAKSPSPKKKSPVKSVRKATPRPSGPKRRTPASLTPRRSARKLKRATSVLSTMDELNEGEDEDSFEPIKFDITKHIDKAYRNCKHSELLKLPVDAILGVGPVYAEHLESLNIFTVEDLGNSKFFGAAYQLVLNRNKAKVPKALATAFKSKWRNTRPDTLIKEPVSALAGLGTKVELVFNGMEMWLVEDLARFKNFRLALHVTQNME